ncbi:hypothetical protein [Beggiatoa leptomitoformis]|uniref:Uncharacterized protein n=1 Tax=Beggiatoa leptomitoformis TaxID=288004 RepID=A0A2N9YE05_9GAMM|nr:hypothetical protein [Beggiatoa leptomitoformis]ALG68906.1 hypothetical protein AL038_15885 [Beggiatoa leptomitoformis]AUI68718.1 hypothetical protein BLE401_08375 [Beggiatoa leptomitoformis]
MLYDPVGSYGQNGIKGENDITYDQDATLSNTIDFYAIDSKVTLIIFPTTKEDEQTIATNMEERGGQIGGYCAYAVSSVVDGIGLFKNLGVHRLPGNLNKALTASQRNIKR